MFCASQKKNTIGQIPVNTYLKFKVLFKGFLGSEKSQKTNILEIYSLVVTKITYMLCLYNFKPLYMLIKSFPDIHLQYLLQLI